MSKPYPEPEFPEDLRVAPLSTKVSRKCACRGWITADPLDKDDVTEAVVRHQLDEPHESWDRGAWVNANTTPAVVRVVATRKVA